MEAVELRGQGWSTARIARRLARDRKTVRAYLAGERTPGCRRSARGDFLRFLPYCRQRLAQEPRLTAVTLFGEITALGYPGGYSTFTRALRKHRARPYFRSAAIRLLPQGAAAPNAGSPAPSNRPAQDIRVRSTNVGAARGLRMVSNR